MLSLFWIVSTQDTFLAFDNKIHIKANKYMYEW